MAARKHQTQDKFGLAFGASKRAQPTVVPPSSGACPSVTTFYVTFNLRVRESRAQAVGTPVVDGGLALPTPEDRALV